MEKKEYQKLVNNSLPKENKVKNGLIAFVTGGIIGALSEVLKLLLINYYDFNTKEATSIVILILIILACFLTAFFDFDKWVIKLKAGLIVPITGFAHSIQSSALDYKADGMITGLGANFFKLAGSVILYGIISAFIFCIVKVVFYG